MITIIAVFPCLCYSIRNVFLVPIGINYNDQPQRSIENVAKMDDEMNSFLKNHPNTPGAKFVELWHLLYRGNSSEEVQRMWSCSKEEELCFVGNGGGKEQRPPTRGVLPLWEDQHPNAVVNAHNIMAAENGTKHISGLGTTVSCLPLMLAGYAALSTMPNGVVVELGPFMGLSSRCIGAGMARHDQVPNSYVAYDTFEGIENYKAIAMREPWTKKDPYHKFDPEHTNFLWVWETAVKDVYPVARGIPGYANKTTLNFQRLENKLISMISIDSAKDPYQFVKQQEGILPIRAGTIWFLMDFGSAAHQPRWLYGCMREYLIPVYASFEQWAFVVKKDIESLANPSLEKCFSDIALSLPQSLVPLERQMDHDFANLLGFHEEEMGKDNEWNWFASSIRGRIFGYLNGTNPARWEGLARASKGN